MTTSFSMDPEQPTRKKRRVEGDDKPEVFTAVPLGVDDEAEEEDACSLVSGDTDEDSIVLLAEESTLSQFKLFSLFLGLLIGVFIQFSSLGANYLVDRVLARASAALEEEDITTTAMMMNHWWFSLVWSFATSSIGVVLLLALRSLLHETGRVHTNLLLVVECHFAAGALTGVCLAWMGTDLILLQTPQHLLHSCFTLAMALGWCKLLAVCFPVSLHDHDLEEGEEEQDENPASSRKDLSEPLLSEEEGKDPDDDDLQQPSRFRIQCISLFLGSLIGLFIQFSSLGANFVVVHHHNHHQQDPYHEFSSSSSSTPHQNAQLLTFSLTWSLATSSMGIAVLFLVRALMVLHQRMIDPQVLMTVECFFATGAVLGLNVAWTATDVILGYEAHLTRGVLTLAGTLLWCRLVLHCCGYYGRHDDSC